jgi:hypothetical protein
LHPTVALHVRHTDNLRLAFRLCLALIGCPTANAFADDGVGKRLLPTESRCVSTTIAVSGGCGGSGGKRRDSMIGIPRQ